MKDWLSLLRVKHYMKNLLVFIPVFFGGVLFSPERLLSGVLGFAAFCLLSSAVYIFNDYRDLPMDRLHPDKKNRPLASGRIRTTHALAVFFCLLAICAILSAVIRSLNGVACLLLYLVLNILYSLGLKNRPIADIAILASGFAIRVFYGGFVCGVDVSAWLFLVVISGSLFMGLGKRRNELRSQINARKVLEYYTVDYLDKNMYVCIALSDVFYALWAVNHENSHIALTIPMFMILLMYYNLLINRETSSGDPVDVILKNRVLICLAAVYAGILGILLYV